jgi:hypothetical protein
MMGPLAGQYRIIKDTSKTLRELLFNALRDADEEPVDVVTGAPTRENIPANRPIVSLFLYNLTLDEEGIGGNRSDRRIERIEDERGGTREVAFDPPLWVRLDYLVSAFGRSVEHEHVLLGASIRAIAEHPTLARPLLLGDSMERVEDIPLHLASRLEEGLLSRIWTSLSQPHRPAVPLWTVVPIYPTVEHEVPARVVEREVRAFDLNRGGSLNR